MKRQLAWRLTLQLKSPWHRGWHHRQRGPLKVAQGVKHDRQSQRWPAAHPVAVPARFSDVDIDEVDWVNDEMLVFSIQDNQRGGADQRYWPGLFLCTATAKVRSDSW